MSKFMQAVGGVTVLCGESAASATPPFFIERSPETVIVNLDLGQTSFECTGRAMDIDFGSTVYFSIAPPPDFMRFESMPGNPGSFRLYGENLTGAHYGGYFVDVIASDSPTSISSASSIRFSIGIIPEPIGLILITVPLVLCRRRRQ